MSSPPNDHLELNSKYQDHQLLEEQIHKHSHGREFIEHVNIRTSTHMKPIQET